MTYITVTWGYKRQCKKVKTFCTSCKKKLVRVVERGYYDNGFHNARETSLKNWTEIDKEAKKLSKSGCICKTCEDIDAGIPSFKRMKDFCECKGTPYQVKRKQWEILSRDKIPKQLGIVREYNGGWAKYYVMKPKSAYRYHRSIRSAAESIAKVVR